MIKQRNSVKIEGSMSSMTDLVFLLLIFFIIMSTMSNQGLPVNLPTSKKDNSTKKSSSVNIGVNSDNKYFFKENPDMFFTYQDLEGELIRRMEGVEDKVLRIHGDAQSDLQQSVNLLGLAKHMGWTPVLVTKAE